MQKPFLIILIISLTLASCTDEKDETYNDETDAYFPFHVGDFWIDSSTYIQIDAPSNIFDTSLLIQKTVVDSMIFLSDKTQIYCTKYRQNNTETWSIDCRFWYEKTHRKLLRIEHNKIWLDLVFPLYESLTWNPYVYTIYSDTTLRNSIDLIKAPYSINGKIYANVMILTHRMDSTLIYKYTDQSFFAKDIGLVHREKVSILSDDPNYDYTLPIEQRIKTASIVRINRYFQRND